MLLGRSTSCQTVVCQFRDRRLLAETENSDMQHVHQVGDWECDWKGTILL